MPELAPAAKIGATRAYGAEVVLRGNAFPAAMAHARTLVDGPRTRFVHAFDDPDVVAGHGTLGLEVVGQAPNVDTVLVPVGGGGLAGGVATAVKARSPETRVVGVQTEGASTLPASLRAGELVTREEPDAIADGIATGGLSDLTFGLLDEHLDDVVVVSDGDVANAILLLLERAKQTSGPAHVDRVLSAVREAGYEVEWTAREA